MIPGNAAIEAADPSNEEENPALSRLAMVEFALNQAREAAYLVDAEGRIQYVNDEACRMLGQDRATLLTLSVADVDADWPRERWPAAVAELRRLGSAIFESRHRRRDGSLFPVEIATSVFHFAGQEHFVSLVRDISERKHLQADLGRREQDFRALAEHSPDVIVRFDREGRHLYVNPAVEQITGLPPEAYIGRILGESRLEQGLIPDLESVRPLREAIARAWKEETENRTELRLPAPNGEHILDFILVPERDPEGRVVSILGIGHDITERKRAEEELRRSEQRFRGLVEGGPDEIARYDSQCRRVYVNPTMEDILGPAARLVGQTPTETYPDSPQIAFYEGKLRETLATGEIQDFEMGWGSPAREPRFRLLRLAPERNDQGEIVGVFAIARDITQRKQMEEALRRGEQRLRDIYVNSPLAYQSLDADGRILDVNPAWCALLGYPRESVLGQPFGTFLSGESASLFRDRFQLFKAKGEIHGVEFQLHCQDGRVILVELDGKIGHDVHSRFQQTHCILHDITARKAAERETQRLNRALLTLSAGNEALIRAGSEEELLARMCRVVVDKGGYRLAWIGFRQDDDGLATQAWAGTNGDRLDELFRHRVDAGTADPARTAMATGQPQVNRDPRRPGLEACVALPLINEEGVLGAMRIYTSEQDAFDAAEVRLLRELADDLAYGIHVQRQRADRERYQLRLQATMEATILALANTVETRDPYTAGHQRRVARLALSVAMELGWEDERVQAIYLAGVVHDIGKIGIPAEILSKPGRLSTVEMDLVRTHAAAGYDILKSIDFPWPIARIVQQHHERQDGSGYPQGLKGDEILMEARILAVCDVVEAMTTHRPYRPGLGIEAAQAEIRRGRDTLYDNEAANACLRVLDRIGGTLD